MWYKVRVCLHGFCHLLRDFINEQVKGLLYVDVVFGTGFNVLYPEGLGQVLGTLLAHGSDICKIRFVANQHYSGILPREVSDGGGPACVYQEKIINIENQLFNIIVAYNVDDHYQLQTPSRQSRH